MTLFTQTEETTMNENPKPLPARFDSEVRFELTPRLETRARDSTLDEFEQLKARLLKPVLSKTPDVGLRRQLRLAANEAAALAWTTPFPLLLLPELIREKTSAVHEYAVRQEQVQHASEELLYV
jgi:hypothetical protein